MQTTIDVSKQKLVQDFNAVVADTERLLEALAAAGAEKGSALRTTAEKSLESARHTLEELEQGALERTRAAAKATDAYVRENPWQSVGVAAALAALVGLVLGLLMGRR